MTEPAQRAWRAACPNCGAPVDFRSAASASAVCGYCRSTLVREGEALRRIGQSAELFDDHTPLQLGASGKLQGEGFTLVGRLQLGSADGPWNEWHALFDNGRSGWLSEDNGRYVFAFDAPQSTAPPPVQSLHPGQTCTVDGRAWTVASSVRAKVLAAEGELLQPPASGAEFTVVDLRNPQDEVGSLEAIDAAAPRWSVGRPISLATLALQGLRQPSEKTLKAQAPACPSCGTALPVTLASSKSVVCGQCKAVVDLSQGVGADLAYYAQDNALEPQIAIGSTGKLALGGPALPWQVVGYVERCETETEPGEEQSAWREYLLYNSTEGFAFLVDTNEGWSWAKTLTGTPSLRGSTAAWKGVNFEHQWTYASRVTYVLGEFYWPLQRESLCSHQDFIARKDGRRLLLNAETTPTETTWSQGESLDTATVAGAFALAPDARAALQPPRSLGALPAMGRSGGGTFSWQVLVILLVVVVVMVSMCSHDECADSANLFGKNSNEYRDCRARAGSGSTSGTGYGGSWGGYSSGGGGHK